MPAIPDQVIEYYDECGSFIDDDAKAMGWSSTFNQQLRFDVFNYMAVMDGKHILDVGCGDAALFHYFQDQSIDCDYCGIDISHKMVQRAQQRYPGIGVRQKDFFQEQRLFDIVVCSGALSMLADLDPLDYLTMAITHLFSLAKEQLLFNLLTIHHDSKSALFHQFDPVDVLNMCLRITPFVTLNHSYLPNDFTVQLIR